MLTLTLAALAQAAAAAPSPAAGDVVVVGHRAQDELAACLARHCPPAEEIERSLQAAVEQFSATRYDAAQATLQRAINRNERFAAELPGPLSTLYATLATVAEHKGVNRRWLASIRRSVTLLRQYRGVDRPETLRQELAFGDAMIGMNQPSLSAALYRSVADKAVASGQNGLAAVALLRQASLATIRHRDAEATALADRAVAVAAADPAVAAQVAQAAQVLRTRIAVRDGNAGAVDRITATLHQSANDTPRLVTQTPIKEPSSEFSVLNAAAASERSKFLKVPLAHATIRTADVGYWIKPDGHTADVEILRSAGLGGWARAITDQVASRRYVPLDLPATSQGIYRVDRFTIRAQFGVPIGSKIPQRMGREEVRIVDLTDTDTMTAIAKERMEDAGPTPNKTAD